jgi:hypothetical protein
MDRPIDFDHELHVWDAEVHDEPVDDVLSSDWDAKPVIT